MKPRIIGITGGISTGKTTVSQYLQNTYNLPIYDADIYARNAVLPQSSCWRLIVDRYGSSILMNPQTLNRKALAEIIFNHPQEKQWLEAQIHPYVYHCFQQEVQQNTSSEIVFVIPLLFEAKMTDLVTEIWVISCSEEQQLQRLQQRDQLSLEQAQIRINNQISLSEKKKKADIVIENQGSQEELYQQVDRAYKLFQSSTSSLKVNSLGC